MSRHLVPVNHEKKGQATRDPRALYPRGQLLSVSFANIDTRSSPGYSLVTDLSPWQPTL